MKLPTHRSINNFLGMLTIALSIYALLIPFWPMVTFWINTRGDTNSQNISHQIHAQDTDMPADDRLLIPDILVDEPVVRGNDISAIQEEGIWLRPQSVEPNEPGNIVLAGHRFTYTQPNGPLYHLDKLTVGDEIGMRWDGMTREYIVVEIKTVSAMATDIEAQDGESKLTIYTCTPLLTAENRLVVIAKEAR